MKKVLFFIGMFVLSTTNYAVNEVNISEKITSKEEIKNVLNEKTTALMFFGCGADGNEFYEALREVGYSHREARALRRLYVRECRADD